MTTGPDSGERGAAAVSPTGHSEAIAATEQLAVVMRQTIQTLEHEMHIAGQIAAGLRTPLPVKEILESAPIDEARERLTDTLMGLDAARRAARRELFHLLESDGVSIGEMARLWGISRQLASRIVHEARGDAGSG